MKEDRFRKMFAAFGTLTDCGLKFTKDGKFRKFGFVGFKSEDDATKALKHFNKSFVDTSRITVSDLTSHSCLVLYVMSNCIGLFSVLLLNLVSLQFFT